MAPEQLEGKEADARSDLWALGCVLYEMATGKRAFEGESQASLIAAIMEREPPPLSQLAPHDAAGARPRGQRVPGQGPRRAHRRRAHDVKLQLQWIAEGGSQAGVPAPAAARRRSRERLAWSLASRPRRSRRGARRHAARARSSRARARAHLRHGAARCGHVGDRRAVAAHLARRAAGWRSRATTPRAPAICGSGRWTRSRRAPLQGTEGAHAAVLVAGQPAPRVLRRRQAQQDRRRRRPAGGDLRRARRAPTARGAANGVIVFDARPPSTVQRVAASGGISGGVTRPIARTARRDHRAGRSFLPDGKHFLFVALRVPADKRRLKRRRAATRRSVETRPGRLGVEYARRPPALRAGRAR